MWITKKKFQALQDRLDKRIDDHIKREITWAQYNVHDMIAAAESQFKADLNDEQIKAIQQAARVFLIDLAEMPPHEFIEALVRKINNVQLDS